MKKRRTLLAWSAVLATLGPPAPAQAPVALQSAAPPPAGLWLDTLDLSRVTQGYGSAQAGRSVDGHPLTLGGTVFPHGIGTHADSEFRVSLHGAATRFQTLVGVDDEQRDSHASVTFEVRVDGRTVAKTGVMRGGDAPWLLTTDLTGAQQMTLLVGDGGDGIDNDHADWAGALLTLAPGAKARPEAAPVTLAPPRLTFPPPDPRPAIHGARVVGGTPGRPFLFRVAATGAGPLRYGAEHLPPGLTLAPRTGIISGVLRRPGRTVVTLTVRGPRGTARRQLTLVGGDRALALTPPMGWNSWNVWGTDVDAAKVKAAADELVSTGLASHGFQYVNVDDAWEAGRDARGNVQSNSKFPGMKALADDLHRRGLKFGLYSSPGPKTCGGYTGSYRHEAQDAKTYAAWGADYLKYDLCTYKDIMQDDFSRPALQKPYATMRTALNGSGRDIVYSICQYGLGDVWTWGARRDIGGNCWRTHGDIQDTWSSLRDIYEHEAGHERFGGPGHWNDLDMLEVGRVGFGSPRPTRLTPNEQILHVSLWCLLSSPLLIGCDLTRLDPFTLALLSNDEALDIDQDPLGKPARRVARSGTQEVWARPLSDGTRAVGLVNGDPDPQTVSVRWSALGLRGRVPVRDLWLHHAVGTFQDGYAVRVPAHGCVLLKVGRSKN